MLADTPTRESINRLRAKLTALHETRDIWQEPEVWEAVRNVLDSVKGVRIARLAADYAGLFLGGRDESVCPTESCYADGSLYGPATLAVTRAYAAKGFMKDPAFGEPDDHIAVELLFRAVCGADLAAKLTAEGAQAQPRPDDAQDCLDFVSRHLLGWVPLLCERVAAAGQTAFYKALLALVRDLIRADARLLAAFVHPPL